MIGSGHLTDCSSNAGERAAALDAGEPNVRCIVSCSHLSPAFLWATYVPSFPRRLACHGRVREKESEGERKMSSFGPVVTEGRESPR